MPSPRGTSVFVRVVAIPESCVNLRRAVQVGVQKIRNGILSIDCLLPRTIHCKVPHTEFIRSLTSEMLGAAEAGSVCSLGMKSSSTRRWRGWWLCRGRQQKCQAEKGGKALLWGRVLCPQEGPPGLSSAIPFLHGKHGRRLLAKTSSACAYSEQNASEV